MPAFQAEVGMPYWIDLATSDPRKSTRFYEEVLGWEVSGEEYRLARVQGLPVAGFIPQPAEATRPNTWITYFLSADIDTDCARARELGGRVLSPAQSVELGDMALLVDVAGGMFGLIQPRGAEHFVAAGEPGLPVWHELSATANFRGVLDFYGELFNWDIRALSANTEQSSSEQSSSGQSSAEHIEYATAEEEGAPFAGFWNAEGAFPPQVPSFWQTYLGVRSIEAAAAAAVSLGGEVIRPAWDSPFGRLCLLADSTGATITLAEVEDAPQEEPRESDNLLNLDL
ncbi:MAG: VOC family protein [Corynebacterium flavescens]|uniref:VOC family protein n=1 Tax=Corynebacterium flavescens TaxID=28028 RepID=UPI0026483D04|nr:VOC family protein [Corynebacterium flavescens]MDN6551282.1 VOC family protein [Corynebacterium flavescens]